MFLPEEWGYVDKFLKFYENTYEFSKMHRSALFGIKGHHDKINVLIKLLNRLYPCLVEDKIELSVKGYSYNERTKEIVAIIETIFTEQMSMIDCMRQILVAIYKNHQGIPSKKTSTLFNNAKENKIDCKVPKQIREALKKATEWYFDLRLIRFKIIHSNVGSCYYNEQTQILDYSNTSIEYGGNIFTIDNVLNKIDSFNKSINILLGLVFQELWSGLKDIEVKQLCCFTSQRGYKRTVKPSELVDFNSGKCLSRKWFETTKNHKCPLRNNCGAYTN